MLYTLFVFILAGLAYVGWAYFYYSYVLGYRTDDLSFELDDWYASRKEHVEATCVYLRDHGYTYRYEGDGIFSVNVQRYYLQMLYASIGTPLQRTILKKIR